MAFVKKFEKILDRQDLDTIRPSKVNQRPITISGRRLKFTLADRTDKVKRKYGHLFMSFNLPVAPSQRARFEEGGEYYNTAFQHLNQDKIIVLEIAKQYYGEMIDGKTISLDYPTSSGYIKIQSSFMNNSNVNEFDGLYSDSDPRMEIIGQKLVPGVNPTDTKGDVYKSNTVLLFADMIAKPNGNSGKSWEFGPKFVQGDRPKEGFNFKSNPALGINADIPVGVAYLDKGFIVITHPTLVNTFPYSNAKGGEDKSKTFTNVYFNDNVKLSYNTFNTEYNQTVTGVALPNQFNTSTNPTYDPNSGKPVVITEIGLYNEDYELVGIAKLDRPMEKPANNSLLFEVQIKL